MNNVCWLIVRGKFITSLLIYCVRWPACQNKLDCHETTHFLCTISVLCSTFSALAFVKNNKLSVNIAGLSIVLIKDNILEVCFGPYRATTEYVGEDIKLSLLSSLLTRFQAVFLCHK